MIAFTSVTKQYGGQILFVDASFQINPGEKVGLVGPNGAGKSTVFRLIAGEEAPDDGVVEKPRKLTRRLLPPGRRRPARPQRSSPRPAPAPARSPTLGDELARARRAKLEDRRRRPRRGRRRASARCRRATRSSAATSSRRARRRSSHGLGFAHEQIADDVGTLSGGWKMRVALAQILLARPDAAAPRRADQLPRHRVDPVARDVPARLPGHGRDDLPRPRRS